MEVLVGRRAELRQGERRRVLVDGTSVMVVVLGNGDIHAIAEACPHHGASLMLGGISGTCVECPWHRWPIDLQTGGVAGWPAPAESRYSVIERDGAVYVSPM